jgi:hypothetical protein
MKCAKEGKLLARAGQFENPPSYEYQRLAIRSQIAGLRQMSSRSDEYAKHFQNVLELTNVGPKATR